MEASNLGILLHAVQNTIAQGQDCCYRASCELCSNYLLCHLKGRLPLPIND